MSKLLKSGKLNSGIINEIKKLGKEIKEIKHLKEDLEDKI